MQSQLQKHADECRVAQANLDDANAAYDQVKTNVQAKERALNAAQQELDIAIAEFKKINLIQRFATEARDISVSEMRRICDMVSWGSDRVNCGKMEGR